MVPNSEKQALDNLSHILVQYIMFGIDKVNGQPEYWGKALVDGPIHGTTLHAASHPPVLVLRLMSMTSPCLLNLDTSINSTLEALGNYGIKAEVHCLCSTGYYNHELVEQ